GQKVVAGCATDVWCDGFLNRRTTCQTYRRGPVESNLWSCQSRTLPQAWGSKQFFANIVTFECRISLDSRLKHAGMTDLGVPKTTLISHNFPPHPFAPSGVELPVENLLPRAKIEFALGNGDDNFASHHLSFYVRIGIVFAGIVVAILLDRFVGR